MRIGQHGFFINLARKTVPRPAEGYKIPGKGMKYQPPGVQSRKYPGTLVPLPENILEI
jgi:hypothetical protein